MVFITTFEIKIKLNLETQNYDKADINNNDQENEHNIIVLDRKDVPNHFEEHLSNPVRDNFFLDG